MIAFSSARLQMRGLEAADLCVYQALYCDPEVTQFFSPALSHEQAECSFALALTRRLDTSARQQWWLILAEAQPVGLCGIANMDRAEKSAELGLLLLPHAHRRGYATEALAALVDWTFAHTDALRVVVAFNPRNHSAHRLTERVGFRGHRNDREGERVAHIDRNGRRLHNA